MNLMDREKHPRLPSPLPIHGSAQRGQHPKRLKRPTNAVYYRTKNQTRIRQNLPPPILPDSGLHSSDGNRRTLLPHLDRIRRPIHGEWVMKRWKSWGLRWRRAVHMVMDLVRVGSLLRRIRGSSFFYVLGVYRFEYTALELISTTELSWIEQYWISIIGSMEL